MKKAIGIFLLLCLLLPVLGTLGWFHYQQRLIHKQVKHKMMTEVDESELVLLQFSKKESQTLLDWEHSKEFEYQGKMYDVVNTETRNDSIFYRCWPDEEETKLNIQLKKIVAQILGQNQERNDNQKHFTQFLKTLYFQAYNSSAYFFTKEISKEFYFTENWESIAFRPSTPPPKG